MKGFLLFISVFIFKQNFSYAQKTNKIDTLTEFSFIINSGYIFNKCSLKNYDTYNIKENGNKYYFRLNAFDNDYSTSFKFSSYKTIYYPHEIIRKNFRNIIGLGFCVRKKYGVLKFNMNYIQRDFTNVSYENNGFLTVIGNYKNQSIHGNSCNIYRYNSNLIECPITYGVGLNKKHFLLNFNLGLNSSFITKEQTFHIRTYYDDSSGKYTYENPKYLESNEIRFYKINLISSLESGIKINSTIAITASISHDFRPFWQTSKTLEIIKYTKSTANVSIYFSF